LAGDAAPCVASYYFKARKRHCQLFNRPCAGGRFPVFLTENLFFIAGFFAIIISCGGISAGCSAGVAAAARLTLFRRVL
jgi:hypothetical protein